MVEADQGKKPSATENVIIEERIEDISLGDDSTKGGASYWEFSFQEVEDRVKGEVYLQIFLALDRL